MAETTIQSSIKHNNQDMSKYALFLGGTNVVRDVLAAYDPLKTGYGRIFMVRKPIWVDKYFSENKGDAGSLNKMNRFKHILEYGNTQIQGLTDPQVNFSTINGGYNGKGFEYPSYTTDDTNTFSITVYEMSGSPIREVIHTWINGTTDLQTGLAHYNGVDLPKIQANQTAEFIYVATDNTGLAVEYCCLFANCFPRGINIDPFNYQSGQHEPVETTIEFACTKYESTQINKVGKALINRYRILTNSLNFNSGITTAVLNGNSTKTSGVDGNYTSFYNSQTNKIATGSASNLKSVGVDNANVYNTDSSKANIDLNGKSALTSYQQKPYSTNNVK
ncbi:MAG: hypothetical protein SOZ83_06045 [Sphaerochaetaceae bacterium]|nr:hypothetical protein [Sphaerochaetaceae bacterium]